MEISYWQSRWKKDNTGWHMDEVFPLLKSFWHRLELRKSSTVLVPLCGKSLDIDWLAAQGYRVIGADVSEKAVNILKDRLPYSFTKSAKGSFTCYKSASVELWRGDFFRLRKQWLPTIDAIYDKAALIALPPDKRRQYTTHLQNLAESHTQIFVNCFEYEQEEMNGPPYAVMENELQSLFGNRFNIELLYKHSLFNELPQFGQRGLKSYLIEKIYHLQPK